MAQSSRRGRPDGGASRQHRGGGRRARGRGTQSSEGLHRGGLRRTAEADLQERTRKVSRGGGGSAAGKRGRGAEETIVLAYHKPKGVITTHKDDLNRTTVYADLSATLPPHLKKEDWHAVGRLDVDSEGLLLLTNDGALVHFATSPQHKVPKTYMVLCRGMLSDAQVSQLQQGVELTGGLGRTLPALVEVVQREGGNTWLQIIISQGLNRQVRRMLLGVDSQVLRLVRTAVGDLQLDVEPARWRMLTDNEVRQKLGYTPKTLSL